MQQNVATSSLNTNLVIKSLVDADKITDEQHEEINRKKWISQCSVVTNSAKQNSLVLQEVLNCALVFQEQILSHKNTLSVNTEKKSNLSNRSVEEKKNITHPVFKHLFYREAQQISKRFANTHHHETSIYLFFFKNNFRYVVDLQKLTL